MPLVECSCGKSYKLGDDFAGQALQCPQCGQSLAVPYLAQAALKISPQADHAFDRDVFLLRQKHLAINQKYIVWNERAQPILFILRPAHHLQGLLAIFLALVAAVIVVWSLAMLTLNLPKDLQVLLFVLTGLLGIAAFVAVYVLVIPKRHVTFYRNQEKSERLLEILQDKRAAFIVATYTVRDAAGNVLALLSKNYLYNFFRKQWMCYAPDGSLLCVAKEDELILALLRRMFGPLMGALRTNFILLHRDSDQVIGEFNRNFTLLDRYVLDLKRDPARTLDRRIALAIGVMLDTGERR